MLAIQHSVRAGRRGAGCDPQPIVDLAAPDTKRGGRWAGLLAAAEVPVEGTRADSFILFSQICSLDFIYLFIFIIKNYLYSLLLKVEQIAEREAALKLPALSLGELHQRLAAASAAAMPGPQHNSSSHAWRAVRCEGELRMKDAQYVRHDPRSLIHILSSPSPSPHPSLRISPTHAGGTTHAQGGRQPRREAGVPADCAACAKGWLPARARQPRLARGPASGEASAWLVRHPVPGLSLRC